MPDRPYNAVLLGMAELVNNLAGYSCLPGRAEPLVWDHIVRSQDIQAAKEVSRSSVVGNLRDSFERDYLVRTTLLRWRPDKRRSVGRVR